jgi:hypothetical protein
MPNRPRSGAPEREYAMLEVSTRYRYGPRAPYSQQEDPWKR